jgi:hypothetical protein
VVRLEALAAQVTEAVADFRVAGDRHFVPPQFQVQIDHVRGEVVLVLRAWTS